MEHKSDIEIANSVEMQPIADVAGSFGLYADDLELYGKYKAKIADHQNYVTNDSLQKNGGNLVLVTAINPTPAGEGKTTTTVGLTDALNKVGKKAVAALREPSLGPVFGVKGGAAGGGYAQVVPMEDINLHFTGDFHAIGAANNLLAALLDNHIKHGNQLQINPATISLKRVVDMNDRQLRYITDGLSGPSTGAGNTANGVPREDGFDITVASEVMAIFCLASDIHDLKLRLGKIVVAQSYAGTDITAHDLQAHGAMAVLLKDAIKPNLVQTLEHNPVLIHGGPFANIAHGCNSVIATRTALGLMSRYGDDGYVVTEAGFGADLGAEKFIDIKCQLSGFYPKAVVIVATIRALKMHGGVAKTELGNKNLEALNAGLPNLMQHIDNIRTAYGIPVVVALNKFPTDASAEIEFVHKKCAEVGAKMVLSDVWSAGGSGGEDLAREVIEMCERNSDVKSNFTYDLRLPISDKIKAIAERIYRAKSVKLSSTAAKQAALLEEKGFGDLPICMAKTQYSFSDDASKVGAPRDFTINVSKLKVCAGAGFIVAYTGSIMTMPGLPKTPAASNIDIDDSGNVTGLF